MLAVAIASVSTPYADVDAPADQQEPVLGQVDDARRLRDAAVEPWFDRGGRTS